MLQLRNHIIFKLFEETDLSSMFKHAQNILTTQSNVYVFDTLYKNVFSSFVISKVFFCLVIVFVLVLVLD